MTCLFRTERLEVRRLERSHEAGMLEVYGDRDAMRYVDDGEPLSPEDAARWIDVTERNVAKRGYGMCAVVEATSGELVGFAGLVHPGGQDEPELKYALRRQRWGAGFATEVAVGMVAWGRQRFGLSRLIATVNPEHLASQRVLEKAGFRREEDRLEEDGSRTAVFGWRAGGER